MASKSPRKFEELVLYIAERTQADPNFGRTKLAKVLFYSDIEAYRLLGDTITGATYYKWDHGPYPKRLGGTAAELLKSGAATEEGGTDRYDPERLIPTGDRVSDLEAAGISRQQIELVDEWIARLQKASAGEVERLSHKHPGYQLAAKNQPIPMDSAFLAQAPPTDEDVARAQRIAGERGWLVGGRWQR